MSYGKDSLAMLEVIHQHGLPLTDIVTADLWATPDIPAYLPDLAAFREKADAFILERYGLAVTHVRSPLCFQDLFYRELTSKSKYTGIYGWPPVFGHWCMKHLKTIPNESYFGGFKSGEVVQYLGIAADEPDRFGQLNEFKRAPLVEFGVTEEDAMGICRGLDMVAPTYLNGTRDGCWFCICQSVGSLRRLRHEFPEYWALMLKWDADTEKRFKIDHTLPEYDRRFQLEDAGLVPVGRGFRWSMLDSEQLTLW